MARKPLYDKLSAIAPAPAQSVSGVVETVDDLERIMNLPRRPPVNCQRDPLTKKYAPETQALIEIMTARFARPPRLSCACRPRRVLLGADGALTVFRALPVGVPPEVPLRVTARQFYDDNLATSEESARRVAGMRSGDEVDLPAADGGVAGHACIVELNAVQSWTLREAAQVGGVVGFLGVGGGKSIVGILAPLLFPDSRLAVLLIEPKQRRHYRSQYLRLREHFRVPTIVPDDDPIPGGTVPGTPPLHLISYSVLSQTKNSDMLDVRSPDVLILDEAHRACGTNSAIGRRIRRYLLERIKAREADLREGRLVRARAVRLLDWSGTLESRSVLDTHVLCTYSLGTNSPLPLDPKAMENWSAVIDQSHRPDRESHTARKLQRAFGGGEFDAGDVVNLFADPESAIREGFRRRRMETPGVISASASAIGASIYFGKKDAPKLPPEVKEALMKVRAEGIRPDGEVLVEQVQQVATARNVACGFYTFWAFPKHPCACEKAGEVVSRRCDQCLLIDDWYAKRKLYNKELRVKLLLGEVYLDSPKLCWDAAERFWRGTALAPGEPYAGDLPKWQCESWPAWKEVEQKVEYEERVKWLDDFLARDAAEWAVKNRGVVWFQSTALGRKISEISGLPYFNGGPGCEDRLRAEKGDRSIICSIPALGAGTDGLQYLFSEQLIVELPASNASQRGLEQLLGRFHREGQRADVVSTLAYLHVTEFRDAFDKAYAQAQFNYSMVGTEQKILLADLDTDGAGGGREA